ncbi:D-glycero-D-manno-heptose 1,7-bisphosphate phosphatase [Mucilaginibacter oryzae]|uniref:D,D-heptose 1,7-bisphosphate phosphatase n=1 Tax=Mucilaginibacter oryzae TaxID=468058 RepID=A0A316HS34_9SPHI|nr:HAD-IIIA family hydrolase [Mucilaginibacter oryzae]PWK77732.1 D-glycero-D-manno-heptose 1,7-bisphosphate phosphatase [Mucilaginibacter oryzae]
MLSQYNKKDTLFLDRDGVINKKIDHSYVLELDQIEIIPGIKDLLLLSKKHFQHIVVVTNQRCVGRGLLSMQKLEIINNQINLLTGSMIDHFFVCPHLDEDNCDCRKPKNGLFLQAKNNYNIDFENSWMIGDSETDIIPAKNLGIKTFYFSKQKSLLADKNISDYNEVISLLE